MSIIPKIMKEDKELTSESRVARIIATDIVIKNHEIIRENNEHNRIESETIRQDFYNAYKVLDTYNPSTEYIVANKVTYQGGTYQCIQNTMGNAPLYNHDNTWWKCISASGDGGGGDMNKSIYDTNNKSTDIFEYTDEQIGDRSLLPTPNSNLVSSVNELENSKLNIGDDYRPNLLNNGDFKLWNKGNNFIISSGSTGINLDLAEKWIFRKPSGSYNVNIVKNDGMTIDISGSVATDIPYLRQYFNDYKEHVNKNMTLSIKINGKIYSGTAVISAGVGVGTEIILEEDNISAYYYIDSNGGFIGINFFSSGTYVLQWVKFEMNDHMTPFIPKLHNEEVLNCSDSVGYSPNLLINGDFKIWNKSNSFSVSPGTVYNISGGCKVWNNGTTGMTVSKNVGGMQIVSTGSKLIYFIIPSADYAKLAGRKMTMSVSINSVIYTITFLHVGNNTWHKVFTSNDNKYVFAYTNGDFEIQSINNNDIVNWVKLELNDHATPFIPLNHNLESLNDSGGYTPNLLINGDFSINQRGQTNYTSYGYTADRWFFGGGLITGQSVTKNDYGVTITTSSTHDSYLSQYVEGASRYVNKRLTLSVCDSMGNIFYGSGILTTAGTADVIVPIKPFGAETAYAYFNYETQLTDIFRVVIVSHIGHNLSIKWVKLELNDHPTPFIPRPVAEEFALCQRYFEYSINWISSISSTDGGSIIGIPFKVRKRAVPTIAIRSQNYVLNTVNKWGDGTNLPIQIIVANEDAIQYINATGVTHGNAYVFYYIAEAEI